MAKYKFEFISGYKKTGKPNIITRSFEAESMKKAESKLRKKYPRACFVSLVKKS